MQQNVITNQQARTLILQTQLLDGRFELPPAKEGAARVIEKLGYVQIDTISVVERAHHHTLWTRVPEYQPEMLDELQVKEKRVFEYWGHAASFLPMADYRYYLPTMKQFEDPKTGWHRHLLENHRKIIAEILERIKQDGALCSKDFKRPPGSRQGGWWDWKPAKTALELLFWQGKLMVAERRGFQRVYDLTERVLPDWVDTRFPNDEELGQFFVRRALQSQGVACERDIFLHIRGAERAIISHSLADLCENNEVIPISIEGEKLNHFILKDSFEKALHQQNVCKSISILSPFDNLIISRERTRRLFEFDFSIECYLPAEKRKFGYFVLPVLWGDQMVARMDVKAVRKTRSLIVHHLSFESSIKDFEPFLSQFAKKINAFMLFNGCEKIYIEKTTPTRIKSSLAKLLNDQSWMVKN